MGFFIRRNRPIHQCENKRQAEETVTYLYWILGLWLASTVILFALFAVVIKLQEFVADRPSWVRTTTVLHWWPVIALGIAWDVVYQYTWAVLLFLELPPRGEYMLTWRLRRYLKSGPSWRFTQALFWCRLIERIDPGHCQ